MPLTGQALCASPRVKLKVSVWTARQPSSFLWCSRGRGPINLEGTLSPGSWKGHSPQGERTKETLSLKSSHLYVFFPLFFSFAKCHFQNQVSSPASFGFNPFNENSYRTLFNMLSLLKARLCLAFALFLHLPSAQSSSFFLFPLAIACSVHAATDWGIKAQSCPDDTCRLHIVLPGASTGT